MSAKYYKRGQREYYQVIPERVIRLVNKQNRSEVTIIFDSGDGVLSGWGMDIAAGEAKEGVEIPRSEFEKEFEVASRLIVLEP